MKEKITTTKIIIKIILIIGALIVHDEICFNVFHTPQKAILRFAKIDGAAGIGDIRKKACLKGNLRIVWIAAEEYTADTHERLEGEADIEMLKKMRYIHPRFELAHPNCKYNITSTETINISCSIHNAPGFNGTLGDPSPDNCRKCSQSLIERIKKTNCDHEKLPEGELDINLLKANNLLNPDYPILPGCTYKLTYPTEYEVTCKYHGPGYHSPNYNWNKDYRSDEDRQKDYIFERNQNIVGNVFHYLPFAIIVLIILFVF